MLFWWWNFFDLNFKVNKIFHNKQYNFELALAADYHNLTKKSCIKKEFSIKINYYNSTKMHQNQRTKNFPSQKFLISIWIWSQLFAVFFVNVNAYQMKLVSNDFLALYDSTSRKIYLFGQSDDFTLENEIDLANKIEAGLSLVRDKARSLSFWNQTKLMYFDYD